MGGRKRNRAPCAGSARLLIALLVAVLTPSRSIAAARGAAGASVVDLSLEELMRIPVYAASRYEQSTSEAPSYVSVVTRDEIRAYGYRTLAELLTGLPGIFGTDDRAYNYIGVRGFGRPGDYNSRLLLLLDGRRLNEEIYGSAAVGTDFPLDMDLVERVEVVRGPGSSLYGSNAFLAVVNVVTRRAGSFGGTEAAAAAGGHGLAEGRLSFGRSFAGGSELVLSGSAGRSAGSDWFFREFDAPETNNGVAEDLDGQEWFSLFASGRYEGFTLEAVWGGREKDVPTASWGTMFNEPGHTLNDQRFSLDLAYERQFGATGTLVALLSWHRYRYRASYPFDWAEEGEPALRVFNRDEAVSEWRGGEVRWVTEAFARQKLSLGLEYRDLFRLDQDNRDDGVEQPNLESGESGDVLGAYVQDEVRLGTAALLNVGARYDRVTPGGNDRVSPRVGLILGPGSTTTVKLLYGEAFRSPNAYELYYDDGSSMKGNPDLGPETIRSYEVAVERGFGEFVQATLSVYRWTIDGLIDQTTDPADGLLVFRNLDHAEARGAEAEVRLKIPRRVEARASYAYCDAENSETGEWLSNSPHHQGSLKATVPLLEEVLLAGAEVRYVGERRTVRGAAVEAAIPVSLTLTAFGAGGRWEASAGVENLFNGHFENPVGAEHVQDAIAQERRTIRVSVTGRF